MYSLPKTWHKQNIKKYTIVFASTQLRISRLRKYPIDPKAYLGRCRTRSGSEHQQSDQVLHLLLFLSNGYVMGQILLLLKWLKKIRGQKLLPNR